MDGAESLPKDLFELCNQVAWGTGGPVLVHDAQWGVLAYSSLPQEMDEARRNVILRREIPESHRRALDEMAVDARFEAGDDFVDIPAVPGMQARRIVAAIRVMNILVGSIWVAESDGPLSPEAIDLVQGAAKQASWFFIAHQNAFARETEIFLSMLLDGGHDEEFIASYLGAGAGSQFCVMTVTHEGDDRLGGDIKSALPRALSDEGLSSLVLEGQGRSTYVVYSTSELPNFDHTVLRAARRICGADARIRCAIGGNVRSARHIPRSRAEADEVDEYLRGVGRTGAVGHRQAALGVALMRITATLDQHLDDQQRLLHPLENLMAADRNEALDVLDSYFRFAANATEAAKHLHMHPNTYRYRLAKVTDLLAIDLDDREARVVLELELIALRYRATPSPPTQQSARGRFGGDPTTGLQS